MCNKTITHRFHVVIKWKLNYCVKYILLIIPQSIYNLKYFNFQTSQQLELLDMLCPVSQESDSTADEWGQNRSCRDIITMCCWRMLPVHFLTWFCLTGCNNSILILPFLLLSLCYDRLCNVSIILPLLLFSIFLYGNRCVPGLRDDWWIVLPPTCD